MTARLQLGRRASFTGLFVMLVALVTLSVAEEREAAGGDAMSGETVVLLHGLGRGKTAMWLLASRIGNAGFDVIRIGYDSLRSTPGEILADVASQIDSCCKALVAPVHFVGHSLGGLMIRAYLAENRLANLGRVVLIGTPNNGTPVVDRLGDSWWLDLAGPTARMLGTDAESFPGSLPDPDYPTGVIAGVSVRSISSRFIPGDDDGLVPVESTKVAGMKDFIIVESGHSFMLYDNEVARQVVAFLQRGEFQHGE